jgi:hypothetical protein
VYPEWFKDDLIQKDFITMLYIFDQAVGEWLLPRTFYRSKGKENWKHIGLASQYQWKMHWINSSSYPSDIFSNSCEQPFQCLLFSQGLELDHKCCEFIGETPLRGMQIDDAILRPIHSLGDLPLLQSCSTMSMPLPDQDAGM